MGKRRKITGKIQIFLVVSFTILLFFYCKSITNINKVSAGDNLVSYKFDLGGGNQEDGFKKVSATDSYSAEKGYGFAQTTKVKNVTSKGTGVYSDAVQFTEYGANSDNTFNVDLPQGLYEITVTLGDTTRTSVAAEGVLQLINMTGNNVSDKFQLAVTDGQLNILATAGKEGYAYSISSIEITQLSSTPTMKQTIWICGDSTVCNYYPKESSNMVGWGQVLGDYVDNDVFEIRNMAAGGQYAKGFIDAGQFDVIEKYGKEGDYYIISIGINDTNYSNESEYYNAVTDMTKRAKEKGITVVLVKQQGRASDVTNQPDLTVRWFGSILDTVGKEQNVQVVDLFAKALSYYKSIGQEATNALFVDDLHQKRDGAKVLANIISEEIKFSKNASNNDSSKSNNNETSEKNIEAPTIYILGDSTACNYKESSAPQTGWGQVIGDYLPKNISIENKAIGGRSSRMFIEEGRWSEVYDKLQPGDYVLVQFGLNDANSSNSARYTPTNNGEFQKCMATFAKQALEKQAIPVFMTPVLGLGGYKDGIFVETYSNYCNATKEVAAEYNIKCIDVQNLMVDYYNQIGYEKAYSYYMISSVNGSNDKTHFNKEGANAAASIIANQLQSIYENLNEQYYQDNVKANEDNTTNDNIVNNKENEVNEDISNNVSQNSNKDVINDNVVKDNNSNIADNTDSSNNANNESVTNSNIINNNDELDNVPKTGDNYKLALCITGTLIALVGIIRHKKGIDCLN